MQITVGANNLQNLLTPTSVARIPVFQRSYSWTKIEITQFLSDIFESAESEEPHFWGPVVVLRKTATPNELEIIDGQQRLTTAVIMLSLLRDEALKLQEPLMHKGTPAQYPLPPAVRNALFREPLYSQPRFVGSYLIKDILEDRIIADPRVAVNDPNSPERPPIRPNGGGLSDADRKHSKELRAAYLEMRTKLSEKLAAIESNSEKTRVVSEVFQSLTSRFEIHVMELVSEDDAYTLFESLNDRGRRLNPSDLLKTLTLDHIRQDSTPLSIGDALEKWDSTVDLLGDFDFTKFLRHFLLTQTNAKVQNRKIFSEFKTQIQNLGQQGAYKNLLALEDAAEIYCQLLLRTDHPNPIIKSSLKRMNIYSQTHRVFLLGAFALGLSEGDEERLTRATELLSYRWISAGKNAQELESIYQSLVHVLKTSPTSATAGQVVDQLIRKAPDDDIFSKLIKTESSALQRYLLLRLATADGGDVVDTAEIEHLAPQSPEDTSHWYGAIADGTNPDNKGNVYEDYVYSWGNLTLLEQSLNRSIRNETWPKKRDGVGRFKGIKASTYNVNQVIKTLPGWTAESILSREKWMMESALLLVSESWVKTGHARISPWRP